MSARKPASRRLNLSPEAKQDIRDILMFTERRWDKNQRSRYKAKLDQTLRDLIRFPARGRSRDDVSPGLRGLPVEAHVIYYRVDEQAINVVRILHGAMDVADLLGE